MNNIFVNFAINTLLISSLIGSFTSISAQAATTSEIKKKAHALVSNKTYRYGKTYYYFSSRGMVYYKTGDGKVKRNYWGSAIRPAQKNCRPALLSIEMQ